MFLVTLQSLHFSDIMAAGSLHVLQCAFALLRFLRLDSITIMIQRLFRQNGL